MKTWVCSWFGGFMCLWMLLLPETCVASLLSIEKILPGFQAAQLDYIDNNGLFLLSNNSNFGFGFSTTEDVCLFLLVVVHIGSSRVVWTASRSSLVENSDKFVFDVDGNAYLENGQHKVWSTDSAGKGVTSLVLQDSGNLVLLGNNSGPLWQSFNHPTDTLLSNQNFLVGMRLVSNPNPNNLSYYLQVESGDLMLYAGFQTPQPYWSMRKDIRSIINKGGGNVYSALLSFNSWRLYDQNQELILQFVFEDCYDLNVTCAAVLGSNGIISFYNLDDEILNDIIKIPQDRCSMPESCGSYYICYGDNYCQCPSVLNSHRNCKPQIDSPCTSSNGSMELVSVKERFDYFALEFVPPFSITDLEGCKDACFKNCSCLVLFHEYSLGNCFLFDQIGSLRQLNQSTNRFVSYVKLSIDGTEGKGNSGSKKYIRIVVIIVVAIILIISGIVYLVFHYHWRKKRQMPSEESSKEDNFWENLPRMPIRFSYNELETATKSFSFKLGHGGFGSVYQGVLQDETKVAVKQLEGINQGKEEFHAEVSTIGIIRHFHLVRLKGFCMEGTHRLLVYEYMANGSLDKWIFKNNRGIMLDWGARFNIALGMAKGLAYLHEDCDVKIVHCDIKPENVLLDDNCHAKVSDFGLAKLMTREQSHVFTTLRGTRGYLAPEWITNNAISEKIDVYSFGMVFLEIIGGRRNFVRHESSEKSHFPSYAFRMMEEGKLIDVFDSKLKVDASDERVLTAIKVALWCIQEDMYLRPSMSKVIEMLECRFEAPQPPTSSYQMKFSLHSSEDTISLVPSQCYTNTSLSDVQLSGPR